MRKIVSLNAKVNRIIIPPIKKVESEVNFDLESIMFDRKTTNVGSFQQNNSIMKSIYFN